MSPYLFTAVIRGSIPGNQMMLKEIEGLGVDIAAGGEDAAVALNTGNMTTGAMRKSFHLFRNPWIEAILSGISAVTVVTVTLIEVVQIVAVAVEEAEAESVVGVVNQLTRDQIELFRTMENQATVMAIERTKTSVEIAAAVAAVVAGGTSLRIEIVIVIGRKILMILVSAVADLFETNLT